MQSDWSGSRFPRKGSKNSGNGWPARHTYAEGWQSPAPKPRLDHILTLSNPLSFEPKPHIPQGPALCHGITYNDGLELPAGNFITEVWLLLTAAWIFFIGTSQCRTWEETRMHQWENNSLPVSTIPKSTWLFSEVITTAALPKYKTSYWPISPIFFSPPLSTTLHKRFNNRIRLINKKSHCLYTYTGRNPRVLLKASLSLIVPLLNPSVRLVFTLNFFWFCHLHSMSTVAILVQVTTLLVNTPIIVS